MGGVSSLGHIHPTNDGVVYELLYLLTMGGEAMFSRILVLLAIIGVKEYTEELHAKRLLKMIKKKRPCSACPGALWFKFFLCPGACHICRHFIATDLSAFSICPCIEHGEAPALRMTILALERKGYM